MEGKLETDPASPRDDFAHDTSVPIANLAKFSSACKLVERYASNSMGIKHDSNESVDSIRNVKKNVSWSQEVELGIALTILMNSESAEPFLCGDCVHGLLGLRTIRKRLAEGRYVTAKMFWSDIDECLSICSPIGRHPFMVWEMRTLFLQSQDDLIVDGCLKEVSLALRSVAIPMSVRADKSERCYKSGTRTTLSVLEDRRLSTGSLLVDTVRDVLEAYLCH